MKRLITLIFVFAAFAIAMPNAGFSQDVRNSSYSTIGHIDSDGTVRNSSYSTIGHIDSDGTIRNSSYSTIGHAKGIKREWAAVWFFFDFF